MKHVWLIEDNRHGTRPNWWRCVEYGSHMWTDDAWQATWFARKEDAERVMTSLGLDNWGFVVLEHGFEMPEAPHE